MEWGESAKDKRLPCLSNSELDKHLTSRLRTRLYSLYLFGPHKSSLKQAGYVLEKAYIGHYDEMNPERWNWKER